MSSTSAKVSVMEDFEYILLPLHGKYGTGKFALVDGDYDGEYFSEYKWYLLKNGYVGRVAYELPVKDRKSYIYLHDMVAGNKPAGIWVDHIDRNKLNNRSCNIRLVTPSGNALNRPQRLGKRVSKSGFRGVIYRPERGGDKLYYACCKGKSIGYFEFAEEAAKAYDEVAKSIYKEAAILNFN